MTDPANTIKWHVVPGGTVQTTELAPNGTGIQDVEKVTYAIDSGPLAGTRRTVTIPVELFNAENVRNTINEDVMKASEVGGLKS